MRTTDGPNGERVADVDEVLDAMAAEPRRRLLASLLEAAPGEAVHLPEAAVATETPADTGRTRVALYHRHLPVLAEAGFVDWETDPLVATRGPNFPAVATVIEALDADAAVRPDWLDDGRRDRPDGRRVDPGHF